VRGHAAAGGENTLGRVHAVDVLGRGLDPHEDDIPVLDLERLGLVGGEHDLAGRGAWRSRKPGSDDLALDIGIDGGMQELVERARIDAGDRLLAGDKTFIGELDRDLERRFGSALARAGLQHPQLALLHREFNVLHILIVSLQPATNARELLERARQYLLHGWFVGARLLPRRFRDLLRSADAGDDVLALGIDQELTVEPPLPGRRIARECHPGSRGLTHVTEHHGLDIDCGAPAFRDVVEAPIGNGALVHPRAEHATYGSPELLVRVLRERLAMLVLEALFVLAHELDPVLG
jgi:hypothetical protein